MWTYLMHDAVNAAQGKTGDQRPSFKEVYMMYFNVEDDSGANVGNFDDEYQNSICQDVCSESKAISRNQSNREKSNNFRKYKPLK